MKVPGWKGDTPGIVHTMPGSIAQGAGCIDPTHPKKGQSWSLYVRLAKLKQCTVKCPPKYGILSFCGVSSSGNCPAPLFTLAPPATCRHCVFVTLLEVFSTFVTLS